MVQSIYSQKAERLDVSYAMLAQGNAVSKAVQRMSKRFGLP